MRRAVKQTGKGPTLASSAVRVQDNSLLLLDIRIVSVAPVEGSENTVALLLASGCHQPICMVEIMRGKDLAQFIRSNQLRRRVTKLLGQYVSDFSPEVAQQFWHPMENRIH